MRSIRLAIAFFVGISLAGPVLSQGNGNGRGNGGGGGNEEPPAEFVPAIAYFDIGRNYKDIRLANRAGDQACTVLRNSRLRGFDFDAGNNRLAYSVGETGIYITTWTDLDGPCVVASASNPTDPQIRVRALSSGDHPEVMDFSPDGSSLVWTEADSEYTGFGTSTEIFIYDLVSQEVSPISLLQWGGVREEWGVDREWAVGGIRFSPDFENSNEIIFVGGPLDGSRGTYDSLYAYNIDGLTEPRQIFDGANVSFDLFLAVTNPGGVGVDMVAITDNISGQIIQLPLDGGPTISFEGGEPAYSCSNTELVYNLSIGRRGEARITSDNGNSWERWSRKTYRWLNWHCP